MVARDQGLFGFLTVVQRHWRLALLVAVPVVIGATLYAFSLPSEYSATAVVSFSPRADAAPGADVRLQLAKYPVYLTSEATVRDVARSLGQPASALRGGLDPSVPAETAIMRVRYTASDPKVAADRANAFADAAIAFARADPVVVGGSVAPAVPVDTPSGPPRKLLVAASLVVAVALASGATVVAERLRPRIRSVADVAYFAGIRVVGSIPASRTVRSRPLDALGDPIIGSAIRSLRTNVDREARNRPIHVLVFTSSVPGEGKTTVTTLFAVALARLDVRVLLIDADLLRPRLARYLDLPDQPGLGAVLRGEVPLERAVRSVSPNLSALPATFERDAGDILARRFSEVLDVARSAYDVVLVDAPPVVGSDLTGTLAAMAEGVLVIVGAGTTASAVRQSVTSLQALDARILGVVANGLRTGTDSYYLPEER